jgi:hypothetical protein
MLDVSELRYWIDLLQTSTPFHIAVLILLATTFALLADALEESLAVEYKDALRHNARVYTSWRY